MEVKKSKRAAIESQRGTWLLMGFVVVLAFMFVTFEWTQHDINVATGSLADEPVFVETLLPITYPEEKLEPPPPPAIKVAELLDIVDDDDPEADAVVVSSEYLDEPYVVKYNPVVVETENEPVEDVIFVSVEKMPEFPGGNAALFQYLNKNIKYPVVPQEQGIQGKVIIQFVVDKDGTITDPVVVRSVDPYLDKEALRVIKAMPKWNPGMQSRQAVRVKYTVPVSFRLQ
ncbi:energy transducer TonB [Bacteroides sp.]